MFQDANRVFKVLVKDLIVRTIGVEDMLLESIFFVI